MANVLIAVWFLFLAGDAAAAAGGSAGFSAIDHFKNAAWEVHQKFVTPALGTAAAAATLQMIFTNIEEIKSQRFEIGSSLMKLAMAALMLGISVKLITSGELFANTFTQYLSFGGWATGVDLSPSAMLDSCANLIQVVNTAIDRIPSENRLDIGMSIIAGIYILVFDAIIITCYFMVMVSIMVAQAEFWMIFTVTPLMLALIPLAAFRDQGMAPVKGLISIGIRIIVLSVILAVLLKMGNSFATALNENPNLMNEGGVLQGPIIMYLLGMIFPAAMVFSAGKLAAAIASGSASFSGADAVRAATTGAAVTAGALGAGAAAGKIAGGALGTAAGMAASALGGSSVGKAARDAMAGFAPGGKGGAGLGVNPTSNSGKPLSPLDTIKHGIGGPAVHSPPSFGEKPNPAGGRTPPSSSSAANAGTTSPGDARGASIGGEGVPPAATKSGPGVLDRLATASEHAANHASADTQAVHISMNTRGGD